MISGSDNTTLYGLIGNPVTHSLSPFIMNRAFYSAGLLDCVYVAFGINPEYLTSAINGLTAMGVAGLNVTYPYKEEILFHLDVISSDAEMIEAVNTLLFVEDEVQGYNTDAPGTATALETFAEVSLADKRVFIFGGGGAARAAALGVLQGGAERVTFGLRDRGKSVDLLDRYRYSFPEQSIDVVTLAGADTEREELLGEANVVINATPVGMAGTPETSLIENPSWIHSGQCFFDFVYHPKQTRFLETARMHGAKTLGGIALLVSQAVESFELWTGHTFDVKEMAAALEDLSNADRRGVN